MINWQGIKDLHVIKRLENIIFKWYNVEVMYADINGKIKSQHLDIEYEGLNPFVNMQKQIPYGQNFLMEDIEKTIDTLKNGDDKTVTYDSYFPHVNGMASKITVDGQMVGAVFAYPFIRQNISEEETKELKKFLDEQGVSTKDVELVLDDIKRMYPRQREKLREFLEFLSEEVASYHTEIQKREEIIKDLNSELGNKYRYHNLIGKSKKMQVIYRLMDKISTSESTILIQGDNGTGKELVAKAIHYNSPRKDSVFLAVNCSAFNDNLLDSELFGHVKGAFTGAIKDKKGFFEQANGGTLFLDEIGDTSLSMQVKLLRVLQEGTFLPVGATQQRRVDVRVVAATNRPLKEMIQRSEFREDLYYRINVINIELPKLKDRKEDIPLLTESFMEKRCAEAGIPTKVLGKKTMEKLLDYNWPGNVRELQNEIERMVVLAADEKGVSPDYLSPKILETVGGSTSSIKGVNMKGGLKQALEELEYMMIKEGLKRCNFNKSKLAKELGISRAGLIMKVDKYGLDKRKKAAGE